MLCEGSHGGTVSQIYVVSSESRYLGAKASWCSCVYVPRARARDWELHREKFDVRIWISEIHEENS